MAKFKVATRVAKKVEDKCRGLVNSIELQEVKELEPFWLHFSYLVDEVDTITIQATKDKVKDTKKYVEELSSRLGREIAYSYRKLHADYYQQFRLRFHTDRLEMIKELELAFGREGVKVPERIITYKLISEKTLKQYG